MVMDNGGSLLIMNPNISWINMNRSHPSKCLHGQRRPKVGNFANWMFHGMQWGTKCVWNHRQCGRVNHGFRFSWISQAVWCLLHVYWRVTPLEIKFNRSRSKITPCHRTVKLEANSMAWLKKVDAPMVKWVLPVVPRAQQPPHTVPIRSMCWMRA